MKMMTRVLSYISDFVKPSFLGLCWGVMTRWGHCHPHVARPKGSEKPPLFERLIWAEADTGYCLQNGVGGSLTLSVTDGMAQTVWTFYRTRRELAARPPGPRLAPVLRGQLIGSAVSFQGFLGVGVLRQLGLAARKRTVLLRIFLCLEVKMQRCWLQTKLSEQRVHFGVGVRGGLGGKWASPTS